MQAEIPPPITFNPYKHHFRFLLDEVKTWNTPEQINEKLLSIGNNLTDFYLGELSVSNICNECKAYFEKQNIRDQCTFCAWLGKSDWKKISLSDDSDWLIKKGDQEERYIHLHPAKFSKHTIRVRATTLKTVLALVAASTTKSKSAGRNLLAVNKIRTKILGLSPVKSLYPANSGILRLWNLFEGSDTTEFQP
ncbi:MAG: hypothetical protein ACK5HT_20590 [Draconibacterium sp.]